MKQLHGAAATTVHATADRCLALLAAVDRYPLWFPEVVREAKILETGQDGLPSRAQVALHVSRGPLEKDFELLMGIHVAPPDRVTLARIPHDAADEDAFDVAWEICEEGESRLLRLAIDASLAVPRFLPLGSIGDELAAGFVAAAARELANAA